MALKTEETNKKIQMTQSEKQGVCFIVKYDNFISHAKNVFNRANYCMVKYGTSIMIP